MRQAVVGEDLLHFARFFVGDLLHLARLALPLAFVVLGIALGGQVSAQSHGDGAGGDLGQSGDDDDVAVVDRAGESGGQREGNGQAVGHADDDVADNFAGGEMAFNVRCLWHGLPAPDGLSGIAGRVSATSRSPL